MKGNEANNWDKGPERELEAKIAEHWFGWVWLESQRRGLDGYRKALFCPANDPVWIRANFYPPDWRPAKPETKRFADWDYCCFIRASNSTVGKIGFPQFARDWGCAEELIAKLAAKDWSLQIESFGFKYQMKFGTKYCLRAYDSENHVYQPRFDGTNLPLLLCHLAESIYENCYKAEACQDKHNSDSQVHHQPGIRGE